MRGVEVVVARRDDGVGAAIDWSVRNPGPTAVVVDRVGLRFGHRPARVLEHGWQSWSGVRRCDTDDVRPSRRRVPRWRRAMYLAEPDRAGAVVAGDQFLLDDSGVVGFVSSGAHVGTVEATRDGVIAWALLDGVEVEPGTARPLDTVWVASGDPGARYSAFVERWASASGARASARPPSGWCSWYALRSAVTPAAVRSVIGPAGAHALDIVQIDDGYQREIGEWRAFSPAWRSGTDGLAAEIRAAGLRAGIWTAPLLVQAGGRLATEHPDWLLRDRRGRAVGAMHHRALWGGWALALDPTHPAVVDHLRATFAELRAAGFDYHKIDFVYAGALEGVRHDRSTTRAQALRRGLDAIREGVGDDAYVVACGCPLGPAVGAVDAMRVSPDVAPWWAARRPLPGFVEAASAARNAIRSSVLRSPMHGRLWANDPDCLLLRTASSELTAKRRALLASVVGATGGVVMVSDDLSRYDRRDWETLDATRRAAAREAPVDLVDPFAPALDLRRGDEVTNVDWRSV